MTVVTIANRLPVRRGDDGWELSPGGLVTALRPVMAAHAGAWVGWDGGTRGIPVTLPDLSVRLLPVGLSAAQIRQYYHGFANATLWPLLHDAIEKPRFERADRWSCPSSPGPPRNFARPSRATRSTSKGCPTGSSMRWSSRRASAALPWPPWPGASAATTCTSGWPGSSPRSNPGASPRCPRYPPDRGQPTCGRREEGTLGPCRLARVAPKLTT
jgi:hypothetical protein